MRTKGFLMQAHVEYSPPPVHFLPAVSDSNLESDSDGSEDDTKDHDETETDTEGEKSPLKLTKSTSLLDTSNRSANCSPLNLIKTPSLATPSLLASSGTLTYHSAPSSSYTLCMPGNCGKNATHHWLLCAYSHAEMELC